MNPENIYNQLNNENLSNESKTMLLSYLENQLELRVKSPELSEQIAYNIAGLLSTRFAQNLSPEDPYDIILTLAGELEIPDASNDEKWRILSNIVESLKK